MHATRPYLTEVMQHALRPEVDLGARGSPCFGALPQSKNEPGETWAGRDGRPDGQIPLRSWDETWVKPEYSYCSWSLSIHCIWAEAKLVQCCLILGNTWLLKHFAFLLILV